MNDPRDIAETVYRLSEAMNELPIARQKARDAIEETIVSLCKLLNVKMLPLANRNDK